MAQSPFNRLELEQWAPSLEAALSTGEIYSQPLPITDPAWCNDIGQRYGGPVACIVDANTYSSGDLFAAGFVDNHIGPVISVGEATGAGGANVWTSNDMLEALADTPFALEVLPDGVQYSIAIRRATRSGESNGVPLEDVGVRGLPYAMTLDDLLKDNCDLLAFCASQFRGAERTSMKITRRGSSLLVTTEGLDALEVYVDGSPAEATRSISNDTHAVEVAQNGELEIVGRRQGVVRQRRRISIE